MTDRNIIALDYKTPEPELIDRAVEVLIGGGLLVAPTETRYGLLARADKTQVVEKVYRVKQRPLAQPIAIFVASIEMFMHYAELNPMAQFLAKLFLPGPLTLVLKALPEWHSPLTPLGKIGIRLSPAPVIQEIVMKASFPLTATSANISGSAELSSIEEITATFGNEVDLYLNSGVLDGLPSTVVDCACDHPKILRHGAIEDREILAALKSQIA